MKLLKKIINLMKRNNDDNSTKNVNIFDNSICEVVYQNNHIEILDYYLKKINTEYSSNNNITDVLNNLEKMLVDNNDLLSHVNLVYRIQINESKEYYFKDLVEFFNFTNNIYILSKMENDDKLELLLSGNVQSFKNIIKRLNNTDNMFLHYIIQLLYQLPYCYFTDLINDNIMYKYKFMNFEKYVSEINDSYNYFKVLSIDNNEDKYNYPINSLLDVFTVTLFFDEVSYKSSILFSKYTNKINILFNVNSNFYLNSDDTKYELNVFGGTIDIDINSLGNYIINMCRQIKEIDKNSNYTSLIPQNISSTLLVTFTYRELLNFLYDVKIDGKYSNINEIQNIVDELYRFTNNINIFNNEKDIFEYIKPCYIYDNIYTYDDICEVIDETEEVYDINNDN